jgi:hypothetical protein
MGTPRADGSLIAPYAPWQLFDMGLFEVSYDYRHVYMNSMYDDIEEQNDKLIGEPVMSPHYILLPHGQPLLNRYHDGNPPGGGSGVPHDDYTSPATIELQNRKVYITSGSSSTSDLNRIGTPSIGPDGGINYVHPTSVYSNLAGWLTIIPHTQRILANPSQSHLQTETVPGPPLFDPLTVENTAEDPIVGPTEQTTEVSGLYALQPGDTHIENFHRYYELPETIQTLTPTGPVGSERYDFDINQHLVDDAERPVEITGVDPQLEYGLTDVSNWIRHIYPTGVDTSITTWYDFTGRFNVKQDPYHIGIYGDTHTRSGVPRIS